MNVVIILLSQSHTQKSPLVPGQASTKMGFAPQHTIQYPHICMLSTSAMAARDDLSAC